MLRKIIQSILVVSTLLCFLTSFLQPALALICETRTFSGECARYQCRWNVDLSQWECYDPPGDDGTWEGSCRNFEGACVYPKSCSACMPTDSGCTIKNCEACWGLCSAITPTPTPPPTPTPTPTPCPGSWGPWGGCSNSCGNGTKTRTCNCSGCVSYSGCSNPSASCGGTDSQGCCSCSDSCSCNAPEPNYQNQCHAPFCGQYVTDTTSGQRCAGSSCPLSCTKSSSGNCADWRSSTLSSPADNFSLAHDMPLTVSGFARDNNGATDGVEDVHIYNGATFWTSFGGNGVSINSTDGSFNNTIKPPAMASLYNSWTGGRDGTNHSYTLNFWAVQTEGNTCPNWNFATRTINLTNTPPSGPLATFKTTGESSICQNSGCNNIPLLSFTSDNILKVEISFQDPDPYPSSPSAPAGYQRGSDLEEVAIIFDDDTNLNNGFFYKIKYTDLANNNFALQEDGGSRAGVIDLLSTGQSRNYASSRLTVSFLLDFRNFPRTDNSNTNIYLSAKDFAGAVSSQWVVNNTTFYPPYWYKLKNASLTKIGSLTNYLAFSPQPYDSDDTNQRYLIIGEAGVVSSQGQSIVLGGDVNNLISSKRWYLTSYQKQRNFFVNQYIEYSKSRKLMKIINNPNQIEENKINLLKSGDITINDGNKTDFEKNRTVIIVREADDSGFAEVTFNLSSFNTASPFKSTAIIAEKITFNDEVTEINGIFLASSFQLTSDPSPHYSTHPLKITGNLSSFDEIVDTTVRRRTDVDKPSIFIVFSPQMYLDLLPYLSVAKYDWRQLQ